MIWLKNFTELSEDEIKAVYRARMDERTARFCLTKFDFAEHCKFVDSLKSRKDKIYFMVYEGDVFIGSIYFSDFADGGAEFGLYKNPELSRVGDKLMSEILRYAKFELGVRTLFLRVLAKNTPALRLYEKYGFKKKQFLDNKYKMVTE